MSKYQIRASFTLAFLLASIVSVSTLNLNDLDALSANDATPGCLSTYSQEISECPSASDFEAMKTCTSSCIDALNTHQQTIILSCRQASVYPNSLLRRLMDGELAITLCPAVKSLSISPASATATSTSTDAETTSPAVATTSDSSSGFLTLTISSVDTSITGVPSELTLDDSPEPTVDAASAYTLSSGTSPTYSVVENPTMTTSNSGAPLQTAPLQTASSNSTNSGQRSDTNGASAVKAVWATIVIGFSVALGAALL